MQTPPQNELGKTNPPPREKYVSALQATEMKSHVPLKTGNPGRPLTDSTPASGRPSETRRAHDEEVPHRGDRGKRKIPRGECDQGGTLNRRMTHKQFSAKGGKAGTGEAKARTSEQARAAVQTRWKNQARSREAQHAMKLATFERGLGS